MLVAGDPKKYQEDLFKAIALQIGAALKTSHHSCLVSFGCVKNEDVVFWAHCVNILKCFK